MILAIKGVLGGKDLSGYVERDNGGKGFSIQSSTGRRVDTLTIHLFDKLQELAIPQRSEIIMYDADPTTLPGNWVCNGFNGQSGSAAPIVDPPVSNGEQFQYWYDSPAPWLWDAGANQVFYDTQPPLPAAYNSLLWTPRWFAGFIGTVQYVAGAGLEREIVLSAVDYTIRMKSTVVNKTYGVDGLHPGGWTDQQLVRDVFLNYRPDVDVLGVQQVLVNKMPLISLPTHTLEQVMERVVKLTKAVYRLDYYQRLQYSKIGTVVAPFAITDNPVLTSPAANKNLITSYTTIPGAAPGLVAVPGIGCELLRYSPDASNLINRVWVIGGAMSGGTPSLESLRSGDGITSVFPLPGKLANLSQATVYIDGVDQGHVGSLGIDGTLDNPSGFKYFVLFGGTPPVIAFASPPRAGSLVTVGGVFAYPLVTVVTDYAKVAATGGLIFEGILRDKRMTNLALAQQVGAQRLNLQGAMKAQGTCQVRFHSAGGVLIQPGQSIAITNQALFGGGTLPSGSGTTLQAVINRLHVSLTGDQGQPYQVEVEFSDQPDLQDTDLVDMSLNELERLTSAQEQVNILDVGPIT